MPVPPDVIFPTYPFRSSTDTSRALRTPRERIHDEISVLEFGSVSTAATCRATIQAAFDSGLNLYFPAGVYSINSAINIPDDNYRRTIRGAGPNGTEAASSGTVIKAADPGFRDYLWKTNQNYSGFSAISSISGISFKNDYRVGAGFDTTPITQTDPPDVGTYSGNGFGCLYLQISWLRITNCMFMNRCGVGLYFPGINNTLSTFIASGGFDGEVEDTFSCGVWGSSCVITSGKVVGHRFGVATMQGPSFISELDVELCHWGILTDAPMALWDRNTDTVVVARSQGGGKVSMHALNFESCGSEEEGGGSMELAGTMDINNVAITAAGQIGTPDCHIRLRGAGGSFKNISGGGNVLTSGIQQVEHSTAYDCIFTMCYPFVQAGKPAWDVLKKPDANVRIESAGRNGHCFIGCADQVGGVTRAFNGAILFHQLPMPDPSMHSEQLISNCEYPEVSYPASPATPPTVNSGKTVLAAATGTNYLTRVICRAIVKLAATANWTTADTVLTVTTNPGSVVAGMIVWKGNIYIGMVSTFTGTTLTLGTNPNTGSGATTAAAAGSNGDILTFSCWTVA